MPAKPAWFSRINEVILDLESLPLPFVDRATLQSLLRVGPRRAQQIMAPCISDHLGSSAPEGYEIHVPKGAGDSTTASLEAIPAANRAAWRLHHVTANDTLATIAKAYNTPSERIIAVNNAQAAT